MTRSSIAAFVLLASVACDARPRTQVMVEIDAVCGVRARARQVVVRVRGRQGEETRIFDLSQTGWPVLVALVPGDGDEQPMFQVSVEAEDADGTFVATHAQAGYVPERTLGLRMILDDDCVDVECGQQACVGGECVPPFRVNLPTWQAGQAACPDQPDAAVDASVFDALSDAGEQTIPSVDFCQQYTRVLCEGRINCCSEATEDTVEACRSRHQSACDLTFSLLVGASADERIVYNPRTAYEVIQEAQGYVDTCSLAINAWVYTLEGVFRAWEGTVAVGERCASTLFDTVNTLACEGDRTCRRMGLGEANSACQDREDDRTGTMTCNPASRFDCVSSLFCGPAENCQPRLLGGSDCDTGRAYACDSYVCERNEASEFRCVESTQDSVYCRQLFEDM